MSYATDGQVLYGPFLSDDLPDYQAAIQHVLSHWDWALSDNLRSVLFAIINRTARFGNRSYNIRRERFYEGDAPNPKTGYAGCAPINPMSDRTFTNVISMLLDMGILIRDGITYTIDYSVTALDLAVRDDVQKRVLSANKRGGQLSTIQGIVDWAKKIVAVWLKPLKNKVERIPSTIKPTIKSQDKSWSLIARGMKDLIMGKQTADSLKNTILASVEEKRDKLRKQRKTRRTLADRVKLFEAAWQKGQTDKGEFPTGIKLSRDMALLKTKLLKPLESTDLQPEDLAYWISSNWHSIGATYFAKSKKYPEQPAFRWVVACLDQYMEAYAHRDELDSNATLSRASVAKHREQLKDATKKTSLSAKKAIETAEYHKAEADELRKELAAMRKGKRTKSDDPIFNRKIKKGKIGKFE